MTGIILILLSAGITAWLFFQAKAVSPALSSWQFFAQLTGVFGLLGLSWNFLLAVRHRWLESVFGGIDKIYRLHGIIGGGALILLLHHPLFLIVNNLPANTVSTYLLPGASVPYTLGILGLYLLLLLTGLTLCLDLPYWLWKQTHEWMGLVLVLGAAHGWLVPSDMAAFWPLKYWLAGWAGAAFAAFVYKRFLYYRWLPKNNYRLERIMTDGEIVVATLCPVSPIREILFEPGQFAFINLERPHRPRDEHPFSVIKIQHGRIMVGIKIVGDFTLALRQMPVGSLVTVRGPYGTFGQRARRAKEMIWISGGIGITPFASMVAAVKPDQKVTMFHSSRDDSPSAITGIFRYWSGKHPNFAWFHHLTGAMGRLSAEIIIAKVKITRQTYFFLCGPPAMASSLTEQLARFGVRRRQIIYEDFGFR